MTVGGTGFRFFVALDEDRHNTVAVFSTVEDAVAHAEALNGEVV
jgi:hypothetical protein